MDHANHAPDTHRRHALKDPVDGRVKANFEYVRVKQMDASSSSLDTAVPLDFTTGIMSQLRVYREHADQDIPSIDYQVVPNGQPLTALVPDKSPTDGDPLFLKRSYVGTITVNVPGAAARTYVVTHDDADACRLDLTKGLNVTCSFDWESVLSNPIGPMLNIDITPAP